MTRARMYVYVWRGCVGVDVLSERRSKGRERREKEKEPAHRVGHFEGEDRLQRKSKGDDDLNKGSSTLYAAGAPLAAAKLAWRDARMPEFSLSPSLSV